MLEEESEKAIKMVISSEVDSIEISLCVPYDVDVFMESLGYEKTDFDCNGWQWDYWITYQKDEYEPEYVLAGCGYHGGITFSLKED